MPLRAFPIFLRLIHPARVAIGHLATPPFIGSCGGGQVRMGWIEEQETVTADIVDGQSVTVRVRTRDDKKKTKDKEYIWREATYRSKIQLQRAISSLQTAGGCAQPVAKKPRGAVATTHGQRQPTRTSAAGVITRQQLHSAADDLSDNQKPQLATCGCEDEVEMEVDPEDAPAAGHVWRSFTGRVFCADPRCAGSDYSGYKQCRLGAD